MRAWVYRWGNYPTGKTMVEVDMDERDYGCEMSGRVECGGVPGGGLRPGQWPADWYKASAKQYAEPRPRTDVIREERGDYYGPVMINHASIGAIWGGILAQAMSAGRWIPGNVVPPEIVCLMMVGVKLSRESYRHKTDNIDDAQNYLDFVDELSKGGV